MVPEIRITKCNQAAVRRDAAYVLYWMIACRRTQWNFSLQRAAEWAVELQKPLVIFEPLRIGYRWASERLHRFVIDGMADNARSIESLQNAGIFYYPYVEPMADADKGLLAALAEGACVVTTDDYPAFFLPRMVASTAARLPVLLEQVDSNGLLPLRSTDRVFSTAFSFRAFLQKELPAHLNDFPQADPLARIALPPVRSLLSHVLNRWPPATARLLAGDQATLSSLAIDHSVPPVSYRGGSTTAQAQLKAFLSGHLRGYAAEANQPDAQARSGLSPYLHFGHISTHQAFAELASREEWSASKLGRSTGGKREGWWGMSPDAEQWLDELVTWRELGYNMAAHRADYESYESLPEWARQTLEQHARDRREHVYSLDDFAAAQTHDQLWNAAQRQLLREGRIHNYLRMLWGKKILEWTASPRDALDIMIELNNRFALDGRDPNSYSGIFWCLGRYDRAWGPERPVFGTVRYMSSQNTHKKLRLEQYLHTFGPT
jgi:deoxyribodipyrimidine photo-lyase